jgi:hypothetical protein|tara:strand:+ start:180 stop:395 length:216 start_codon:yes stop_codon:yes gene_type:complete
MREWYDNHNKPNSNFQKLLQERIEKTNPCRTLTANVALSTKQRRYAMKSYEKLKAKMETIRQQMAEGRKKS